jgi:hypothetical protein
MIFGTAFRTARGGLLPDYAHGLVACLILRLVRVRVGNFCVPSRKWRGCISLERGVLLKKRVLGVVWMISSDRSPRLSGVAIDRYA